MSYTIEDEDITLLEATKEGYTFRGFYKEATYETLVTQIMTSEMKDVTLYTQFTINTYTITYNLDGGVNGNNPVSYTIEDEDITLLEATKEGYTFRGFYKEATYETLVTQIMTSEMKDVTLYTQFTINTYTISFDSDFGTFVSPFTQVYNSAITSPSDPTREGYTFTGWDIEIPSVMPSRNITIKALWSVNTYTISFDSDFGTFVSPFTQVYNSAITSPSDPTREGYTFTGWDIEIPSVMPSRNITIKALWSLDTYTITYNLDGGVNGNNPVSYTIEDESIVLNQPKKERFVFEGFFDNALFSGQKISEILTGNSSNITLYAKFVRINEWTISIDEQTDETIKISIYVGGYVNFAGFDIKISYNQNTVTLNNITNPIGSIINSQVEGDIKIVFVDVLNIKTTTTLVTTILFDIRSIEKFEFDLIVKDMISITEDYEIINVDYEVIPLQ